MTRDTADLFLLVFVVVIVADITLMARWNRWHYASGLPLFVRRIRVKRSQRAQLRAVPLQYLQDTTRTGHWADIVYRQFSATTWAFRERHHWEYRGAYFPVMHGMVTIDLRQGEIRVVGRSNWSPWYVTACVVAALCIRPAWSIAIAFAVMVGGSYLLQRWRYGHVADAVEALVEQTLATTQTPPDTRPLAVQDTGC